VSADNFEASYEYQAVGASFQGLATHHLKDSKKLGPSLLSPSCWCLYVQEGTKTVSLLFLRSFSSICV